MKAHKVIRALIEFGFALMGSVIGGIAADRWLQAQENEARLTEAAMWRARDEALWKGSDDA